MLQDPVGRYSLASLVLRLALAAVFIYHGLMKVTGPDNEWGAAWANKLWQHQEEVPPDVKAKLETLSQNPADRSKILEVQAKLARMYAETQTRLEEGLLQHHAAQIAVAWGELLGGLAMLLGLLTRVAAAGLIIIQLGAIITVTGSRGFDITTGGYEYNVALVAMCLALMLTGGGALAADHVLFGRRRNVVVAQSQVPARV